MLPEDYYSRFLSLCEKNNYISIEKLKKWANENAQLYNECLPFTYFDCDECKKNKDKEEFVSPCVFDDNYPCKRNNNKDKVYFCWLYENVTMFIELHTYENICEEELQKYFSFENNFEKTKRWFKNVIIKCQLVFDFMRLDENRIKYDNMGNVLGFGLFDRISNENEQVLVSADDFKNIIQFYEINKKHNTRLSLLLFDMNQFN